MKNEDIIRMIANILNVEVTSINLDSSADNVNEWDSLGHLSILVALDKAFDGKLAGIGEMAGANSVQKIISILKNNSLI